MFTFLEIMAWNQENLEFRKFLMPNISVGLSLHIKTVWYVESYASKLQNRKGKKYVKAKACWEIIDQKPVFVLIVATLISHNGCGPKSFKIILAVLFYLDFLLSGQKGKSMCTSLKLTKNALKVWSHHHFSLLILSIATHDFSLATSHFKQICVV